MATAALRVALFGPDASRIGGQAIRAILTKELCRRLPQLEITPFSVLDEHCDNTNDLEPWELQSRFPQGPDAILVGGGDLLGFEEAAPSDRRIGSLYAGPANLWLLPALLAEQWNVPVLWNALGAPGPFAEDLVPFVQLGCRLSGYRSVRDPRTWEALRAAGVEDAIEVVPDCRVLLADLYRAAELEETWRKLQPGLGLSGGRLLCFQSHPEQLRGHSDELAKQLDILLEGPFRQVLLLPLSQAEHRALQGLQARLGERAVLLRPNAEGRHVAAVIRGTDAFVGTSLHGCLTALAYHRPHLCLAGSGKLQGYLRLLERPACALASWSQLTEATAWLLADQIPHLRSVQARLGQQAAVHFDRLAAAIQAAPRVPRQTVQAIWRASGLENTAHQAVLRQLERCTAQARWQGALEQHQAVQGLQAELRATDHEIARLRKQVHRYQQYWLHRLVDQLIYVIKRWRYVSPSLSRVVAGLRWLSAGMAWLVGRRAGLWLDRLLFLDPPAFWLYKPDILKLIGNRLLDEPRALFGQAAEKDLSGWFRRYQPKPKLLQRFRARSWPAQAPFFSLVLLLNDEPAAWLEDTLRSIAGQCYPHFEVLVVPEGPAPAELGDMLERLPEVKARLLLLKGGAIPQAPSASAGIRPREQLLTSCLAQARGDYLCFLDQGDWLEPQALPRLAETILNDPADLLTSDEVRTGPQLDLIRAVQTLPAFSYYYYLCYPYFPRPLALRTETVRAAGGLGRDLAGADVVDLVLRLLERADSVSHIPDLLYRRRHVLDDAVAAGDVAAAQHRRVLEAHLQRRGCRTEVQPTGYPGCWDVRFALVPRARVAILIPTKNGLDLLSRCLDSLEATVPADLADIVVIDHDSTDPKMRSYLDALRRRHHVIPYQGPFNFSALNNHAVAQLPRTYSHYLFLNNDIEARELGWLEHMLGYGQQPDVGVVGALLLYPDRSVQHGGGLVGVYYAACHAHRYLPGYEKGDRRAGGPNMMLQASRELSIVTAACMLVRADLFQRVRGFDPTFAVGFGDSDLCLRIGALGYQVVFDAQAVLLHHESATRGQSASDPHPVDSQKFRTRYLEKILSGDPFHSPLLSRYAPQALNPCARCCESMPARCQHVGFRVARVPAAGVLGKTA